MTTLTETAHTGEFIVSEANGNRSRDLVTIAAGADLIAGTVLGVVTASGKYKAFDQDAGDGSETAAAVLFDAAAAASADVDAVAVVRAAEVNGNEISWPGDIDAGEKVTAIGQLADAGIVVRT